MTTTKSATEMWLIGNSKSDLNKTGSSEDLFTPKMAEDLMRLKCMSLLFKKCFTGNPKVRQRPSKSTTYGESKWLLVTPKTAWI